MSKVKINNDNFLIKMGNTTIGTIRRFGKRWKAEGNYRNKSVTVFGNSYRGVVEDFSSQIYN